MVALAVEVAGRLEALQVCTVSLMTAVNHTPRKEPSGRSRALGFVTRHSRAFCTSSSTGCGRGHAVVVVVVGRVVVVFPVPRVVVVFVVEQL